MNKYYIGIPIKDGCHKDGADKGIEVINNNFNINEIVNIINYENDIDTVYDTVTKLASIVDNAIKNNYIPVSIGGDHSLAIGSIAGVSANYDNLGLLWIDSHSDINTDKTTLTHNIHGYPVAISMGLGLEKLINVYQSKPKLKSENIVLFGINDVDPKEQEIIDEYNIKTITYDYIQEIGLDNALNEAYNYLKEKTNNIHISFDIDCTNPNIFTGVNVPSNYNKGFNLDNIRTILSYIKNNINYVSIDVVEYNPLNDKNNITLNLVLEILNSIESKKS